MKLLRILALHLLAAIAVGQSGAVTFELGYGGTVVEDAWNPLRVVLREQPAATLEVTVDQGSLRSGPIPLVYRVNLPAAHGVHVYEDDLYIPAWRSLTWTLRTEERILASGGVDPRLRDDRQLVLLVSRNPGRWLGDLASLGRLQDMPPASLPVRAAAYSGVRVLLVDGTTAAPDPSALVSAAVSGATVALLEPAPAVFEPLLLLAGEKPVQLGAGWIVAGDRATLMAALGSLEPAPVEELAVTTMEAGLPSDQPLLPRTTVGLIAAGYALVALLLLRFGGAAGFPAVLMTGALLAAVGWTLLRPPAALDRNFTRVVLTNGGISLSLDAHDLRSLPGGTVELDGTLRPRAPSPRLVSPDATELAMGRWQRELLLGKPVLGGPALEWTQGALVNSGATPISDVLVLGMGVQAARLAPGERVLPRPVEESEPAEIYALVAPLLPPGTALGRSGAALFVTLPDRTGGT